MSDSDEKPSRPSDASIDQALRNAVLGFFKANDTDAMTLKSVRSVATKKLNLGTDFFKTDSQWKDKSKEVVTAEVDRLEETYQRNSSPPIPKGAKPAPPATSPPLDKPPKRKSVDSGSPPAKRQKHKASPPPRKDSRNPPKPPPSSSPPAAPRASTSPPTKPSKATDPNSDSDSALSSPIDKPSPPRRSKAKSKAPSASSKPTKPKSTSDLPPDEEEIKKLQSQLIKCGVRKLWGKELARFDSPRDKIAHLKGLLREVGIGGRFSEDKARQIREERELKADLEAIQEGDRAWGRTRGEKAGKDAEKEEGDEDEEPRKRSMAKGLQELQAFAGDEESD